MANRRYVVAVGSSAVRIPEMTTIEIPTSTPLGQSTVRFRTRYSDEGFEAPIPRELWAEVEGEADCSFDDAINLYWNLANSMIPTLAVIANAPIDDLTAHLALDVSADGNEHSFFQNFLPFDTGPPKHGRALPSEQAMRVFSALEASQHKERLQRAIAFYAEALRYLKPGEESRMVLYLWMAVEALTKVALRTASAQEGCTENELVIRWDLAKRDADNDTLIKARKGLDGEARRRLIFHADASCQRYTVDASDGFEHGFEPLDKVRLLAKQAIDSGAAQHIRRAILELMELGAAPVGHLTTGKYEKPRANWLITKYLRGTFVGPADQLAAPDQQYPLLKWDARIKEFRKNPDGTNAVTFDEQPTVVCGDGVTFRPQNFQVWGPENDPVPSSDS